MHHQPLHHPGQPGQREVQRDGGVGGDHPLHAGMADVPLVPQHGVLQRRRDRPAHDAGQAGQVLAQHRVALVRHRRRALLARVEELLRLAHFAALQVAHFGRQPLDPARDHGERAEIGGMAVARDDLGGYRFDGQAELLGHIRLNARVHMGEGADGAADRGHRHFGTRCQQPGAIARKFCVVAGELQAEAGGLGMDAVAAADGECVLVLERTRP